MTLLSLSSYGCKVHYDELYLSQTKKEDIVHCKGPTMFVGALSTDSTVFLLGAFVNSSIIRKGTCLNTPKESNGVCWYMKYETSFGFLDCNASLSQIPADNGTTHSESRLSWNVDNGLGGYRAGRFTDLGSGNSTWRKVLYMCPGKICVTEHTMMNVVTMNSNFYYLHQKYIFYIISYVLSRSVPISCSEEFYSFVTTLQNSGPSPPRYQTEC